MLGKCCSISGMVAAVRKLSEASCFANHFALFLSPVKLIGHQILRNMKLLLQAYCGYLLESSLEEVRINLAVHPLQKTNDTFLVLQRILKNKKQVISST